MKSESEQRYVDILSNAGFKAFFGDESNKESVVSLLNTLLPAHRQIKDIEYRPTEHQGPIISKLCVAYSVQTSDIQQDIF